MQQRFTLSLKRLNLSLDSLSKFRKDSEAMKWCCAQFKWHFEEAGRRGFGVFAASAEAPAMFVFQHRSIDRDKEPPTDYNAPLSLVADVGILFCPWCGVRLLDFYRDRLLDLDKSDLRVSI
jgi:hypothetical protein